MFSEVIARVDERDAGGDGIALAQNPRVRDEKTDQAAVAILGR